jgi:Glycosyl transferases group 1
MDIVCVSHLRWEFVLQRPQHLLSRAARDGRVLYVEEPVCDVREPHMVCRTAGEVTIAVPHLPASFSDREETAWQARLLEEAVRQHVSAPYVLWFYTPMAVPFTRGLAPAAVVYDCMDELSGFAGAPPRLKDYEQQLFQLADVVFAGGQSLYEAKRHQHSRVIAFPSSVDVAHFARARTAVAHPAEQERIPAPRIGYYGVIDERLDYALLRGLASARPDWHFVLVGPTAKIDPAALPRAANLHYLGPQRYDALPGFLAGWDVAMLPFAHNDATRFISPTKTPEYLAAGRAVVSTSIRDVVRPYGQQGLVRIADTVDGFVAAIEASLAEDAISRQRAADAFLSHLSWDGTWRQMRQVIGEIMAERSVGIARTRTAS